MRKGAYCFTALWNLSFFCFHDYAVICLLLWYFIQCPGRTKWVEPSFSLEFASNSAKRIAFYFEDFWGKKIDARTSFSFLLEYCWFYSFFLFCFTSICVFVSLPALSCFSFFKVFKHYDYCKFSGQFPIDCCQWNTVFHISLFYQKIEEVRIILTDHSVVFVLNNQLLFCEFVNVFHIFSLCPIYNMFLNFHLNSVSFMSKDIQLISKPSKSEKLLTFLCTVTNFPAEGPMFSRKKKCWSCVYHWIIGWVLFSFVPVMFAYEQCLLCLGHHPDIWYEAATYLEQSSKILTEKGVCTTLHCRSMSVLPNTM